MVVEFVVVGFIIILMSTMRSFRWSEKNEREREMREKIARKKEKKVFSLSNYRSTPTSHKTMLVGDEFFLLLLLLLRPFSRRQ